MDFSSCGIESKPVEIADCLSENCINAPEYSWKIGAWGTVFNFVIFVSFRHSVFLNFNVCYDVFRVHTNTVNQLYLNQVKFQPIKYIRFV